MKKIAIIYRDRENIGAIENIRNNILGIFDSFAFVTDYYLNEMEENQQIQADAYLVLYEEMLYALTAHIRDFSKVIIISRSLPKKHLSKIMDIPPGTDVLIINDSRESTLQTAYIIYELGISHLNLIPYNKEDNQSGAYHQIEYAIITPNLEGDVPTGIANIINIQYRDVNFETFLRLMRMLELEIPIIERNIMRKIHDDAEPNVDAKFNYMGSYLKEQIINRTIKNSPYAILLLDKNFNLVYSNDSAEDLFSIGSKSNFEISSFLSFSLIEGPDFIDKLMKIKDENYLFEKVTITLVDEIIGYYVSFQNEKQLRDREISLNSQLKKKGFCARYTFDHIIHQSPAMLQCINISKKAALSDYTILIRGESGTGKELLAQSIHNYSKRSNEPFVAVNCAALPESLLESELFGYEKGSFTGAQKNGKVGLFEQAQYGTIMLDEIGDISPKLQSRLLRVIQEKQVMRVGSEKVIDTDVRIIAATNTDLEKLIAEGKFREDLYFRLNVITISIAPLRNRQDDILPLLKSFLPHEFATISESDKTQLLHYHWPGNVRQLENTASFFKTLGLFPEYIYDYDPALNENTPVAFKNNPEYIKQCILKIINQHSSSFHGIGRTPLCAQLKQNGICVSDAKMRLLLGQLQSSGLVTIGLGRKGTQITDKGESSLAVKL